MLFFLGDTRGSVAAAIVTASVMTFLGLRTSDPNLPRRQWLGLGLLGGGMVILGIPIGVMEERALAFIGKVALKAA